MDRSSLWKNEAPQEGGVFLSLPSLWRKRVLDPGPKFTWLNASFAMKRQAVRLRPGPQNNFKLKTLKFKLFEKSLKF